MDHLKGSEHSGTPHTLPGVSLMFGVVVFLHDFTFISPVKPVGLYILYEYAWYCFHFRKRTLRWRHWWSCALQSLGCKPSSAETRAFSPYLHSLAFNYRQTSLGFYSAAIFQIYCISDTFKNSTSVWELQDRPVSPGGLTALSLGLLLTLQFCPPLQRATVLFSLIISSHSVSFSAVCFISSLCHSFPPIRRASRSSLRRPLKKIWMSWFSPCWSTAARRRWTRGSVSILLFFFFCSLHHTYLNYSVFIEGEENFNQTFESIFMTDLERLN